MREGLRLNVPAGLRLTLHIAAKIRAGANRGSQLRKAMKAVQIHDAHALPAMSINIDYYHR
jgi:hypothetical protein